MNNPSEISKEWYSYAERDLITANHLVKTLHPVPLEIVCYHCQQSSEKFLKGYIAD
ncbi:HEPN domain-containing protein [Treponema sp. OMZ 792]|nr:HEPN domain-containing protein [Treponema sp. OMZ 792]UTC80002.1 HEPN domain-containing protein [Treponema sp. OMZ 798]